VWVGKEKESEEQKHGLRSWSSQRVQGRRAKSRSTAREAGVAREFKGPDDTDYTGR